VRGSGRGLLSDLLLPQRAGERVHSLAGFLAKLTETGDRMLIRRPAADYADQVEGTASSRAPSRPRWFGWPTTCVPGPSRRPTRSSPPPAASASCRNRVGHIGNQLLPARLGSPHCPADVGRWRSGSQVRHQGELLLIRQKAPSWQQVGRVRANARVQAGTSEAAGALT
jgi:hypothetical protein